jgi:putative heme iron utilization protein
MLVGRPALAKAGREATMKQETARRAAELVRQCRVATLGTLHDNAPLVSMVPFAVLQAPFAFIVLVSGLSAHTRDMLADPRVSLLVMEPEVAGAPVHALARISVSGEARPIRPDDPSFVAARAAYAARFPDMTGLFELGDFGLFAIRPVAVRVVAGFAQAHTIEPDTLAQALATP